MSRNNAKAIVSALVSGIIARGRSILDAVYETGVKSFHVAVPHEVVDFLREDRDA